MVAVPLLNGALPNCVVPEVNVTVPVGVAAPAVTFTVAVIVSSPPAIPGLGVAVTVVDVCAWFTTWLTGGELLAPLYESPGYDAVMLCVPTMSVEMVNVATPGLPLERAGADLRAVIEKAHRPCGRRGGAGRNGCGKRDGVAVIRRVQA